MSPVRNRRRTLADNDVTIDDLRRRCEEKGLSSTGRKATLISRLQQHASENTNPGTSTRSTNITDAPISSLADVGQAVLSVPVVDLASSEATPRYGNAALDVPAAYVKQIQSGEFFDLSKLLPSDFPAADDGEPVVLTLENSIISVKKPNPPTQKITNIEQCTTAFTTYIGVLTSKFPGRSQELLQYMSLIRHAAQTHRGLGWCIYDHKFRQKAALNATLK